MLYLTCTTKTSVDIVHYGVSRAKKIGYLWIVVQISIIFMMVYSMLFK